MKNFILVGIVIVKVMKEKNGREIVLVMNMWWVYIDIDRLLIVRVVNIRLI